MRVRLTLLGAGEASPPPGAPPHFPRDAVAAPGEPVSLGRSPAATLCVPADLALAPRHALLVCYADACRVFDTSGHGIVVDGARTHEARIAHGAVVRAGDTAVRAAVLPEPDGEDAPSNTPNDVAPDDPLPEDRAAALAHLRAVAAPLYAVLDGAQRGAAVGAARAAGELAAPLPDGGDALDWVDAAPWLVRLPPESPLLERLFRVAWGTAECVFLTSTRPFAEVRAFLRGLFFEGPGYAHPAAWRPPAGDASADEADPEPADPEPDAYFRFYDPHVLAALFADPGADVRPLFGSGTVLAWYCEALEEAHEADERAAADEIAGASGFAGAGTTAPRAAGPDREDAGFPDDDWVGPDDPDAWADAESADPLPPTAFLEFRAPDPTPESTPEPAIRRARGPAEATKATTRVSAPWRRA